MVVWVPAMVVTPPDGHDGHSGDDFYENHDDHDDHDVDDNHDDHDDHYGCALPPLAHLATSPVAQVCFRPLFTSRSVPSYGDCAFVVAALALAPLPAG